ncbi:putative efflux protein, MATE family [Methanosarcina thermophila]|jgi:putative MATE family efflux protein|uniref:Multidrug export protein MepA n=3 Tax=Methanosarcina thermophila TaxID=2210 RepID=A0A1I6ZXD2_METTE|nr:MATE family efflux transporter [Methanosarcina thermophila]AKB12292.1 Multi antimicrobial extrusion protein (Na(+)/drug antiporter), MATE family of MDR efflux pumps [Methanosarcina thermophila TM-1]AKB14505.1 Multi antimicrobial extrusion protein (Na(+)/drug antiporter), MATE family of MDR efflux pumps [Methanosarcina thermophila CHTI-55]NLU56477.1 MATE family efflux transporter [Methanosarcina thermophila]SFT67343.1 putative efflux protein, MATE family [Methanosarcina thermophila]BAW29984.
MDKKSEFLGKESIRKLLFKLSAPIVVGMLVQAFYNVVDTFFVGMAYGTESVQAIGGLSIAFPIQMIVIAFGIVLGTGGSSIISRALGAREYEKAERVLGNIFSLSLILSVLVGIPCLYYLDTILKVFGATAGVLPYARDYLQIIIAGGTTFVFGVAAQHVVRSEGNARLAMNAMLVGGGLNIFLDPFFMFGFGMGVKGAAIATVLSQVVVSVWLLLYYLKGKGAVHFRSETLKPDLKIVKEIGAIGIGSFIMQCSNSIMMIFVYNALATHGGDTAIAVFGVIMRINSFIFMSLLGMAFGLQPIAGFNYGAKKYGRIAEAVKLSLAVTTTIGVLGLLFIFYFRAQLLQLFSSDPHYLELGKNAMVIMLLGMPLVGLNIITSTLFQALGKARPAFLLSISRQLLFLIPAVTVLPNLYGLNGVWAAFPVADFLAFTLSGFLLSRIYRFFKEYKDSLKAGTGSEVADKISSI